MIQLNWSYKQQNNKPQNISKHQGLSIKSKSHNKTPKKEKNTLIDYTKKAHIFLAFFNCI